MDKDAGQSLGHTITVFTGVLLLVAMLLLFVRDCDQRDTEYKLEALKIKNSIEGE